MKSNSQYKFLIVVFIIFFSSNTILSQGPNAPEAASFEPVDATDMVNLSTGDLTYVLPLLNVPSPEGGYPIALAYHAGIAMDQETSWTGLGWNLNAGAINRSINGYPDDYTNSLLTEYFYDEGEESTIYSLSLGYSNGASSMGLGFSWGSNKSLGGFVSIGYGVKIGEASAGGNIRFGTDGNIGIGFGVTTSGGLTFGVSANSNGSFGGSLGFDNNGAGFSINANSNGSYGFSFDNKDSNDNTSSIGVNFSSSGVGINAGVTNKTGNKVDGGAGAGIQLQFENTISMGDYSSKTSGWQIPLVLPLPGGIFSLSFGKQKFEYHLAEKKLTYVNGPVYFDEGTTSGGKWGVTCMSNGNGTCGALVTNSYQEAVDYAESQGAPSNCDCFVYLIGYSSMDIYEVSLKDSDLASDSNLDFNSAAFPSYDKYNVQAQGLSGGMSSRLFENGNLFGLSNRTNSQGYRLRYALDDYSSDILPDHAKFDSKPYFYFDNEISTYLGVANVSEADFNTNSNSNNILSYYSNGVELSAKPRRKNATYVDYYTNEDISENYQSLKAEGYLLPGSGFNINADYLPEKGIGAFKVTAIDGKTYHYSLPVYNHEIVTRTFGVIADRPNENQAYFEKRQLDPYSTHWLLTAVTGPDYFDTNDNGIADKGDYGYWASFEYGKWSDAFVWKNPYGEDYFEGEDDSKTWIRGRKQMYYLDRVRTRTHTAIFVKSERQDSKSIAFNYSSVAHADNVEQDQGDYQSRFSIPSQKALRLDKILLLKESDDTVNKTHGASSHSSVTVAYNNSIKPPEQAWYNLKDNVIDTGDNWSGLINKALKVIDFNYDYSLAKGSPNTASSTYGRLSLESVDFKGKSGGQVMPPYSFDYINNASYNFDIEDKENFGYYRNNNALWSLNKITTPQGGEILIEYETNKFSTVFKHEIIFKTLGEFIVSGMNHTTGEFEINSNNNDIGLNVGDVLYDVHYRLRVNHSEFRYDGTATITQDLGQSTFKVVTDQPVILGGSPFPDYYSTFYAKYKVNNVIEGGGARVASLTTTDGANNYRTEYNYGENDNGLGYISYLPFASELQMELPYSSELPAPKTMYEYVSMESFGTNNQSEGKIQYKFKILKEKDENDIKFGDLYEIDVNSQQHTNTSENKDVVVSSYTIKDNLSTLGQLLEVVTYNNEGQMSSKIENTYYSPDDPTPDLLGVTKEAYQTYKIVDYTDNTPTKKDKWLINSSARIKYPNLLKSSTEYKSNYTFTSSFGSLDEITGQATEVLSVNSLGDKLKTESTPAYTIPQYNPASGYGMGSKVDEMTNKNMLTQEAVSKSYIEVNGQWKETGVGISTWNNDWTYSDNALGTSTPTNTSEKIWRKHKSFAWDGDINPDGTLKDFNATTDDNFNWALGQNVAQTNDKWKNISTTTKYDHFSTPLEVKDINTNFAVTKMCDDDTKVLFTANSKYYESFYTGAEYDPPTANYIDNQIRGSAGLRNAAHAHTGNYSLAITPSDNTFGAVLKGGLDALGLPYHNIGDYKLSVWVHKDNYLNARFKATYNGALQEFNGEIVFAGDWVQMNHYYYRSVNNDLILMVASASGTIYIDDFRVHPLSSSMTSYVYNEWDELSYILGSNNLGTHFIYDEAGRLIETQSEVINTASFEGGFKKVTENKYNYKNN